MGPGQFLNFGTIGILDKVIFFVRGHPVNFRMFSSMSDLYSLGASSNPLVVTIKIKLILKKNTCL